MIKDTATGAGKPGKALSAVDQAEALMTIFKFIPAKLIKQDEGNLVREGKLSKTRVSELAASIAEHGLLQPIVVAQIPDESLGTAPLYQIVAGRHRFAALKQLGLLKDRIAVRLVPFDEADNYAQAIAENVVRTQLTPLEEADAFARLVDIGQDPEQIAAAFCRTPRFVRQRMQLNLLCAEGRRDLEGGKITLDLAGSLARYPEARQQALLKEIAALGRYSGQRKVTISLENARHLLESNQARAEVALFDVEKAGIEVKRDLFDDKDDGLIEDVTTFLQHQRAAVREVLNRLSALPQVARVMLFDHSLGGTSDPFPTGFYDWSVAAAFTDVAQLDEYLVSLSLPPEKEGVLIGDINAADYRVRFALRIKNKSEAFDPKPGEARKPSPGPAQRAKRDPFKMPDHLTGFTELPSGVLSQTITTVRRLIGVAQAADDPYYGMMTAIARLATLPVHQYSAFSKLFAQLIEGGPTPLAKDLITGWRRLAELAGLELSGDSMTADEITGLPGRINAHTLLLALQGVNPDEHPELLQAALTLTMADSAPICAAVREIKWALQHEVYSMGPIELRKLTKAQLEAQLKSIGRQDLVRPKMADMISGIVAEATLRAQDDAADPMDILPVFAHDSQQDY